MLRACFFAGLLCAQDDRVCTVSGTITDARSGAPIETAELIVTAQRPAIFNSVTHVDGKFTMRLDRGSYTFTVVAKGYSQRKQPVDCVGATTNLIFELPLEAIISGRVIDDEGHTAPGAFITLLRMYYMDGQKRLMQSGGSRAGKDGEYRFDNVAEGSYYLLVTPPKTTQHSEYVLVPTYYPNAIDVNAAATIRIRPGEMSGTDIHLNKVRAFSVRGRLHGADGGELRGHAVALLPSDYHTLSFRPIATIRDDKGEFEFTGVTPGDYTLVAARVPGHGDFGARLRINVGDSDLVDVDLFVTAGNPVFGTLSTDDKEQHSPLTGRVVLHLLEDLPIPLPIAESKAGHFEFERVMPATYCVVPVRLSPQSYAKALRVDGRDSPDWIADLTGPTAHSLEVVLGFDAGRVGGFARDGHGDPAPKKLVVLVPAGNGPLTTPQYATTYSDDHGRYAFSGVQPGQYKLFAFENVNPGAVQNRQTLRQFETLSADAQVQPNTVATADVNVIAASATASIE